MKVLVISDTHGDAITAEKIVAIEKPDLSLHLGDYGRDLREGLRVKGNCDGLSSLPSKRILELKGHRLLMTHGHKENVKVGLQTLYYQAKEAGADIALFGHTHQPFKEDFGDLLLLNPGSLSRPPLGKKGSYLLLLLEEDAVEALFKEVE